MKPFLRRAAVRDRLVDLHASPKAVLQSRFSRSAGFRRKPGVSRWFHNARRRADVDLAAATLRRGTTTAPVRFYELRRLHDQTAGAARRGPARSIVASAARG